MSGRNNPNKIIESFKLLYKLGRPLGLACYTFPSEYKSSHVTVTTLDVLRLIFLFTTHVYLTFYNYKFWDDLSTSYKKDTIFNTGIKLISTGSLLLINVGMVVVFLMRERIWYIVVALQEMALEAEKFDMKIENSKTSKYFKYYLIVSSVTIYSIFIAYVVYVSNYIAAFDALYFLSYIKANVTFAYLCCKFQFLIFSLGIRFNLLNIMFEKKIINALISTTNVKENLQRIGDLIFIAGDFHDKLNALVIRVNSYFAIMILPIYAGNFTITVFCCHNLYKTFLLNDSTFFVLAIFLLVMAIYFNLLIVFITIGCGWTKKMADKLGVLVHKAATKTNNKFILRRLNIISQQVLHISPTFSCGFFVMDWPMQFTFVSALTSYLIILMQFQNYINNE